MKSADIKVGETYVYQPKNWHPEAKATVLETGVSHKVEQKSASSYRTKTVTKTNGVKIKVKQFAETVTKVVEPRTLREPWSEYSERKRLEAGYKADAIAQMRASAEKVKTLLPGKVWDKHLQHNSAASGKVHADGSYTTRLHTDIHSLAELLEAAYEKGKADAEVQQ